MNCALLTSLRACVASSVSLYFQNYLTKHTDDYMYHVSFVFLCYCIEMCIGISVAAMPSVARLHRAKGSKLSSMLLSIGRLRRSTARSSENGKVPDKVVPKRRSHWPEVSTLRSFDFSDNLILGNGRRYLQAPAMAHTLPNDRV